MKLESIVSDTSSLINDLINDWEISPECSAETPRPNGKAIGSSGRCFLNSPAMLYMYKILPAVCLTAKCIHSVEGFAFHCSSLMKSSLTATKKEADSLIIKS